MGNGFHPFTQIGPVANTQELSKIGILVADAIEKGARALTGGDRLPRRGLFYEPTVLVDVSANARVMLEEFAGPVAILTPFEDLIDGLKEVNWLSGRPPEAVYDYRTAALILGETDPEGTPIDYFRACTVGVNPWPRQTIMKPTGGSIASDII